MLVPVTHLHMDDIGWVIDTATAGGESVTLVTCYSRQWRRNSRQDSLLHAAKAEALWRGCRVEIGGGTRRRRLGLGCRQNLVLHIDPPPPGGDGASVREPRHPKPSGPSRAAQLDDRPTR